MEHEIGTILHLKDSSPVEVVPDTLRILGLSVVKMGGISIDYICLRCAAYAEGRFYCRNKLGCEVARGSHKGYPKILRRVENEP